MPAIIASQVRLLRRLPRHCPRASYLSVPAHYMNHALPRNGARPVREAKAFAASRIQGALLGLAEMGDAALQVVDRAPGDGGQRLPDRASTVHRATAH